MYIKNNKTEQFPQNAPLDRSVPKVTFKPLSRGRFRCNQTSEIVRAGQTKKYAKWRIATAS